MRLCYFVSWYPMGWCLQESAGTVFVGTCGYLRCVALLPFFDQCWTTTP